MKKILLAASTLLSLGFLSSFVETNDNNYEAEVKQWQQKRIEGLKREDGWLNLAGLFWLKEGENTIGGSDKNAINFPKEHSADFVGKVILKEGKISFVAAKGAKVTLDNQEVNNAEVFPYQGKPIVLAHQSLRWFIIQRGDKYAIRLRDLESPFLKSFTGIPTFPIDAAWRVKAKFVPTEGRKLKIIDITGRAYEQDSPGKLIFSVNNKEYTLEPTGTPKHLSLVFGDLSNKHETYGAGRFLEVDGPDAEGYTYIDFNKSYNPPCAFTPFATCPLPTKENKLEVAILAGEKRVGEH